MGVPSESIGSVSAAQQSQQCSLQTTRCPLSARPPPSSSSAAFQFSEHAKPPQQPQSARLAVITRPEELTRVEHDKVVPGEMVTSSDGGGGLLSRRPFAVRVRRDASALLRALDIPAVDLIILSTLLGRGQQAEVFAGTWQGLNVAVKQSNKSNEMLRREVRALSRVQHPNVVRLYGVCNERLGIVLARATGTLGHVFKTRNVTCSALYDARLLAGIARGMAAVHAHGILHLDLKPDNVLLSADGSPWVTDFGLSTSTAASGSLSSASARGTLAYKAPELFRTQKEGGALLSQAVDVYAFAVLAYQLLTKEEPWPNLVQPIAEILAKVLAGERPGFTGWRKLHDANAPALVRLIEDCWKQEHKARPAFGGAGGIVERLDKLEALENHAATKRNTFPSAAEELKVASTRFQRAEEDKALLQEQLHEMEAALCHEEELHRLTKEEKNQLKDEHKGLQVANCAYEQEAAAARKLLQAQPTGGDKISELTACMAKMSERMEEIFHGLRRDVQRNGRICEALVLNELSCPRMPWLQPDNNRSLRQRLSPTAWTTKRFRLFFVCPVTMRVGKDLEGNPLEGYPLTLPEDWVVKFGPAIQFGVTVLSMALAAGRIAGLPLPGIVSNAHAAVLQAEAEAVAQLQKFLGDSTTDALGERAGQLPGSVASAYTEATDLDTTPSNWAGSKAKGQPMRGAAYRRLSELVQQKDPTLQHCGLEKHASLLDGSVEWVSKEGMERFDAEGQKALCWAVK